MIRIVIAEDSAVTREHLTWLLQQQPDFQVVGLAPNGEEAVALVERLKPDIVLMDIHMPRLNGYQATRQIMGQHPTPIVMVSASIFQDEMAMSFEALQAGALSLIAKPPAPGEPGEAEAVARLIEATRLMAGVKVVRRFPPRPAPPPPVVPAEQRRIRLVALGASTGGPQVLAEILQRLPKELPVPILVVQHIAPGFLPGLVQWLGGKTGLRTALATPGEVIRAGTAYLAPDGWQMGIGRECRIQLAAGVPQDGFCPSVSRLFDSVAASYGGAGMGVLLTGMGRDGVEGLRRLRAARGVTVAQDQESCVVFGMPGEAVREGLADYVLPPVEIARLIITLTAPSAGNSQAGEEASPCGNAS